MHRFCRTVLILALATAGSSGPLSAQPIAPDGPVPLTVAVDTSRSLRPGDLTRTTDEIKEALALLPSDQPTGLLAFDDSPRWIVPVGGTPTDVTTALDSLDPDGSYTQLHDALVVAARAMEGGGVILLATDGRDENSATTLEDVARVCESQGVRILPIAMGPRVQERSLRRLALLTGGEYIGHDGADRLVDAVTRARGEVEAFQAEAQQYSSRPPAPTESGLAGDLPESVADAAGSPSDTAGQATSESSVEKSFPLPLVLALVAILVLAVVLARLLSTVRRPSEPLAELATAHYCLRCGGPIGADGAPCPRCEEESLIARLRDRGIMQLRDTAEMPIQSPNSLEDAFDPGVLEVTRVLADENLITIRGQGVEPRSYLLSAESAFAVGRDNRTNTIGLTDTALSARHFKIVPDDGRYYVIDLGSTNGTYVNDQPIQSHRLQSGDVIRAGRTEFEYRSKARALA